MLNLLNQNYKGIQGVKEIDSGVEGSSIGISACTHGGEHAGLKTIEYLYEKLDIENNLVKGKIYFILTNIEAYKKSLINGNKNPNESRFIEENLNRCCSIDNIQNSSSYEVRRAQELTMILKKLDFHLDIHSTSIPTEAMLITTNKGFSDYSKIFNSDIIYSGIPEKQIGKPFIDITERNGGVGMGLEAGYEKDNIGFEIGVDNSIRLLQSYGMIDEVKYKNELKSDKENKHIKVYDTIIIEGDGFKPMKEFNHKEIVKKGEIIALFGDKEIKAKKDSYILMPNTSVIGEEFCFLGEV